jgi:hypothetical protein
MRTMGDLDSYRMLWEEAIFIYLIPEVGWPQPLNRSGTHPHAWEVDDPHPTQASFHCCSGTAHQGPPFERPFTRSGSRVFDQVHR